MKKLSLALLALLLPGSALAARQFVTAPNFRVGDTPNIMIAADFNGDGNLDLASTHVGILANGCVIQLGNGNGTFHSASQAIDTTNPLFSLVTADFNRDGKPDIALTTETDSEIWLGNGDGTFTEFSTPSLINSAFIAGDFNNDGIPDLLVLNLSQSMLLGNGDGSFRNGPPGINNLPQGPLTITDVNGDGKLDMVFATTNASPVTVYLGNGDGSFQAAYQTGSSSTFPSILASGDFNGDGLPDLAVLGGFTAQKLAPVTIFLNQGEGTYGTPITTLVVGTTTSDSRMVVEERSVSDAFWAKIIFWL